MNSRTIKTLLGPVLCALAYFLLPKSIFAEPGARLAIGTVVWMAFWWITAPVEYAVTAFLPIGLNALFTMTEMQAVIGNYASETILLLLGASVLTVSWGEVGLDKRIAAGFLSLVGGNLRTQLIFWFILSASLSSILPNAVVCATITPIAVSMLKYVGEKNIGESKTASLVLLTIVYATGVGGLASPLGGAMNLVAVDYIEKVTGQEYMYTSWVVRFLPIMIVLIISNLVYLVLVCKKGTTLGGSKEYFKEQFEALPKMTREEKWSFVLFAVATIMSFTRQFYQSFLPGLKPAYVFIICAIVAFFITHKDGTRLMMWKNAEKKIVWELMYVFAGGLAAGTLINGSGAAESIGKAMAASNMDGGFMTVFAIVTLTVLLSDVTSNTATAAVSLPIVVSIIQGIGKNPIPYIYIAAIGINLSYLLPTSIRAIPVGYGLKPKYMLKHGIPVTIMVIVLMSVLGWILLKYWAAFGTV